MTDMALEARDLANAAIKNIEAHEKVCTERQSHIVESLREIKQDLKGLYNRFWVAAIFVITMLIGVVSSLIYLILGKGH